MKFSYFLGQLKPFDSEADCEFYFCLIVLVIDINHDAMVLMY